MRPSQPRGGRIFALALMFLAHFYFLKAVLGGINRN
jgi:hypothetical protein